MRGKEPTSWPKRHRLLTKTLRVTRSARTKKEAAERRSRSVAQLKNTRLPLLRQVAQKPQRHAPSSAPCSYIPDIPVSPSSIAEQVQDGK